MRYYVEYHNRSDTSNIKSEHSHLKFIQKLSEQQNWKPRNQGTTKKQPYWHCGHNSENIKQKYKTFIHGNNITCTIHRKGRITSKS